MQLKVGSYYLSREGRLVGPAQRHSGYGAFAFKASSRYYRPDGRWAPDTIEHRLDLVKEVDKYGNPLAHEMLKQEGKWGDWVVAASIFCCPADSETVQLPDGKAVYRVKKAPIIITQHVSVTCQGKTTVHHVPVIDGVVQDLLIKGKDL